MVGTEEHIRQFGLTFEGSDNLLRRGSEHLMSEVLAVAFEQEPQELQITDLLGCDSGKEVLLIPVVPIIEGPEHAISVGKSDRVDLDRPTVTWGEGPVEREQRLAHRPHERLNLPSNELGQWCEWGEGVGDADVRVLGMRREIADDPHQ